MENKEIKENALDHLKNNWGKAIAVCFIVWLITEAYVSYHQSVPQIENILNGGAFFQVPADQTNMSIRISGLINLLIGGPLALGESIFFLNLIRNQESKVTNLFDGFNNFIKAFVLYLLANLFIFLWSLLLIIPGIVAALNYSMSYFIMCDNPDMSSYDALKASKEMMYGHKGELFYMILSFLGWFILGLLTAGVGFIFINPYYYAAKASFYEKIKYLSFSTDL